MENRTVAVLVYERDGEIIVCDSEYTIPPLNTTYKGDSRWKLCEVFSRDMKVWISDDNGNRASIYKWGSVDAAKAALATLVNCRYCTDCKNCVGCNECNGCVGCSECAECRGCDGCKGWAGCEECTGCGQCVGGTMCTG